MQLPPLRGGFGVGGHSISLLFTVHKSKSLGAVTFDRRILNPGNPSDIPRMSKILSLCSLSRSDLSTKMRASPYAERIHVTYS